MNAPIEIREDLSVIAERRVIAHLRADEALLLAGELARSAFRRIAKEEGADELLYGEAKA